VNWPMDEDIVKPGEEKAMTDEELIGEGADLVFKLAAENQELKARIAAAIAVEDENTDTAFYVIVGKMIAALKGYPPR
jgi:hypothetical protein